MVSAPVDHPVHDYWRRVITIKRLHLLLLAGVAALGVLVPALPAQAAYAPWGQTVTCDGATRTVSATISRTGMGANNRLTVYAFVRTGGWDLVDQSVQPHRGTISRNPVQVTVTADANGNFTTPVFTLPFVTGANAVANYTETWGFNVYGPDGALYSWGQYAMCRHDSRTVLTNTCDGDGDGAVGVSGSGLNAATEPTVQVTYYRIAASSNEFATGWDEFDIPNLPVDRRVTVPVNADGTWADEGIVRQATNPNVWYSSTTYKIIVGQNGIVGGAQGACVLVDRRTPR